MWCCAMLPLAALILIGPMYAAGRGGFRSFAISLACGWGAIVLVAVFNPTDTLDLIENWQDAFGVWMGIAALMVLPGTLGAVVLYVRRAEGRWPDLTKCRQCGYDLRASPDRCPECGTPSSR